MKKLVKNLTSFIIAVCILFSAAACDFTNIFGGHKHKLEHIQRVEATCRDLGNVEYWRCKDCGELFIDENAEISVFESATVIKLTDHDFGDFVTVKEPTETEVGSKKKVCKVCGEEVYQDIEKLPHTHVYSSEWSKNSESHFHKATCCQDAPIKDEQKHVKGDDDKCTVCGYDMSRPNVLNDSSSDYGYKTLTANEKAFYNAIDEKLSIFHESGDAQSHVPPAKPVA